MDSVNASPGDASPVYLLILFADELVPRDKAMTRGFKVPGKGVKVQVEPLAQLLAARAFWSAREHGLISLGLVHEERKSLVRKKTKTTTILRVERTDETDKAFGTELLTKVDMATALVAKLVPPDGAPAYEVAASLVGKESDNPNVKLLGQFLRFSATEGVLEIKGRPLMEPFVEVLPTVHEPAPERLAALEPAIAEMRHAWTMFKDRERELYDALLAECKRGIDSMWQMTSYG